MFIQLFVTVEKLSGPNGQLMTRALVFNGGIKYDETKRLDEWGGMVPTQDC